jgi:hypothetical protein
MPDSERSVPEIPKVPGFPPFLPPLVSTVPSLKGTCQVLPERILFHFSSSFSGG